MLRSYLCRASLLILAAGTAALTVSCGRAVVYRGAEKDAPEATQAYEYSLKVYVTDEKGTRLVEIPPLERGAAAPADGEESTEAAAREKGSAGLSLHDGSRSSGRLGLLGLIDFGQAGAPMDTEEEDAKEGGYPGWTLLEWARNACWLPDEYRAFNFKGVGHPWQGAATTTAWYTFDPELNVPQDCDHHLAIQEVLLCMADRLAEVADSVGKVVWNAGDVGDTGDPQITVTIPPQATKDKFIARDMAMNVLAHLAKWNSITPAQSWPDQGATCDDAYAAFANGLANVAGEEWIGTFPDDGSDGVRHVGTYFPPADAPATETALLASVLDQKEVGAARLQRKAALLSAAGRLMKDLIEKSVETDVAGAEAKRASAGDALRGLESYWGRGDPDVYNTMRHVLSVLYGRLEMGPYDPSDLNFVPWDPGGPTPSPFKVTSSSILRVVGQSTRESCSHIEFSWARASSDRGDGA